MSITPEVNAKTITQLVATEIKVQMARADVRQSQLARLIGKNEQWLSVRLRGRQPIDINDLQLIAEGLEVGIHDLLPAPEVAARAVKLPYRDTSRTARLAAGVHAAGRLLGGGRRDSPRPASPERPGRRRPTGGRPADRPRLV